MINKMFQDFSRNPEISRCQKMRFQPRFRTRILTCCKALQGYRQRSLQCKIKNTAKKRTKQHSRRPLSLERKKWSTSLISFLIKILQKILRQWRLFSLYGDDSYGEKYPPGLREMRETEEFENRLKRIIMNKIGVLRYVNFFYSSLLSFLPGLRSNRYTQA